LRYSDILERHLYQIDFDSVRECEFDSKHLGIVLKKNNDNKTLVVVPLTTKSNGEGTNKINLGKIPSLPSNMNTQDSYAAYNQIRTVNYKRFYPLKDDVISGAGAIGRVPVSCGVSDAMFIMVLTLCLKDVSSNFSNNEKIDYHHIRYTELIMEEIKNIAYEIKSCIKQNVSEQTISVLKAKISELYTQKISYTNFISETDVKDGIVPIIDDACNINNHEFAISLK